MLRGKRLEQHLFESMVLVGPLRWQSFLSEGVHFLMFPSRSNEVNLLYIDQPVQVGYSYDTPTNITVNLLTDPWSGEDGTQRADFSNGVPEQNNTFLVGTAGSQNVTYTANSTIHAAVAMWHFAQTWFEEYGT